MVLWLGCGTAMGAQKSWWKKSGPDSEPAVTETQEAEIRVPVMRPLRKGTDDKVVERIESNRAKLPAQYRKRNNFAWAAAKVDGLKKTEYFAHSGIQDFSKLSQAAREKVEGISLRPKKGHFKALCVNQNDVINGPNCWVRTVDTEYKILEDIAARLPDKQVQGQILLYTDLPPCASCWNVMKQFLAEYPNIQMRVLHKRKEDR